VVTHGPQCLDGVTAAVAVARFHDGADVRVHFCAPADAGRALLDICAQGDEAPAEIWVTDIAWTEAEVDRQLEHLVERGVGVFWIDHHRSAIQRHRARRSRLRVSGCVLSEEFSAARLTYDYLCRRLEERGGHNPRFMNLAPFVAMADDHDRWLHRMPGSRDLALAVAAMPDHQAYLELLEVRSPTELTPALRGARKRAAEELQRSTDLAVRTRYSTPLSGRGMHLVVAVCDGYASEIAEAWGRDAQNTVFAFFDTREFAVSLRRSPDCRVDLSRVATRLGGGGHAAAAGCRVPELAAILTRSLADVLAAAVREALATDEC
jgi:oligoribonuclease NrnB/cAMP/cGMP phosphodiesterase (DHH superfamily)